MRALIADDEAPARAKIRRLLEAAGGVELVGEASTGRETVAAIKRTRPDVVFLDIQMPGLDGFGVVEAVERDGGPFIVFVTANDQHALRAFEVGAVEYLLKPFTPERFAQVLERARERIASPAVAPRTEASALTGARCSSPSSASIASRRSATTSSSARGPTRIACARRSAHSQNGSTRHNSSASIDPRSSVSTPCAR
jgi:DNA-binding LytR/AlgR family response regulator